MAETTQSQSKGEAKSSPAFTIDPNLYYSVGKLQEMGISRDGRRKLEKAGAKPRTFGRCRVYLGQELVNAIEQQAR